MEKGIWLEIEELYKEFQQLGISQSVDYEKYYLYSLITHSTAIEGSTLTEMDAQLLFDEGVTAKGKPLVYHLMNEDLKKAYELAKKEAQRNTCLLYTSDAADDLLCVDFGGRRIIKKKHNNITLLLYTSHAKSTVMLS